MHNYGLISDVDAATLEKTMDLICADFWNQPICVTEVGLYSGKTARGIREYIILKDRDCQLTGIDNYRDGEKLVHFPPQGELIVGNSNEVYYKLQDFSQHLIFVDGLHTFSGVVSDFFCYESKVKVDGFIAFHDAGWHIKPKTDWQRVGSKEDPDSYISVRKALNHIGLLSGSLLGWELIFDECDTNDRAGGICVFKKTIK